MGIEYVDRDGAAAHGRTALWSSSTHRSVLAVIELSRLCTALSGDQGAHRTEDAAREGVKFKEDSEHVKQHEIT